MGEGGGCYGFLFRSEFFFRTTRELEYLFFCRAKREIFFHNSTLGYITKTLNQIIFFPPPKSEYFFQQHWESEYFFRKKTITPLQVKWSFPYSKPFLNNKIKLFCDEYHADIFSMHNFSPLKQKKYNFVVLIQTFSCCIST